MCCTKNTKNDNKNNIPDPCLTCERLIPNSILIKGNNYNCREIEVYYLTENIRWLSSYIVILEEETLKIRSWFNLTNNSGIDYLNTDIKFVAGNVRLPQGGPIIPYKSAALDASSIEVEELRDYYSYTLADKYDVLNNTLKKIKNFSTYDVSYRKIYDFGYNKTVADITIKFLNTTENNLGLPFPLEMSLFMKAIIIGLNFLEEIQLKT